MTEERIYDIAAAIYLKYESRDLAHDGYGIWLMAGDFLRHLVIPFARHPLAVRLMDLTVNLYSDQYESAHKIV